MTSLIGERSEKDSKEVKNQGQQPPQGTPDDFFKGFEEFAKKLGGQNPGDMQVSEEEMAEATKMFQEMFKVHDETAHNKDANEPKDSDSKEAAKEEDTSEGLEDST